MVRPLLRVTLPMIGGSMTCMVMCGNGAMIGMEIMPMIQWLTLVGLNREPRRYAGAGAGSDMDIYAALPIETIATPPAGIEQPVSDLSGIKRAI